MTPEVWTAISSGILALTAAVALVVAWSQLGEMRQQRRDQNRAYVLVSSDADVSTQALYFVVQNVGRTHASNVTITFSEAIEAAQPDTDFESRELWNPPLLPPGYSYRTVLDYAPARVEQGLPMSLEATVTWLSPATDGETVQVQTYTIDFHRFFAMREWVLDRERDRTEALKQIAKHIGKIAAATGKP